MTDNPAPSEQEFDRTGVIATREQVVRLTRCVYMSEFAVGALAGRDERPPARLNRLALELGLEDRPGWGFALDTSTGEFAYYRPVADTGGSEHGK